MGIFRREEKKVRETIELYISGLMDKDIDMLMSLIILEDDFLLINQNPYEKIIGAKKFNSEMKEFFKAPWKLDVSINWMFLSIVDNMAWANSEMVFRFEHKNRVFNEERSITFVLEKRRGDWYIAHVINAVNEAHEDIVEKEEDKPKEKTVVMDHTEVYDFTDKDLRIKVKTEDNGDEDDRAEQKDDTE